MEGFRVPAIGLALANNHAKSVSTLKSRNLRIKSICRKTLLTAAITGEWLGNVCCLVALQAFVLFALDFRSQNQAFGDLVRAKRHDHAR
jgi:hypothetical protein